MRILAARGWLKHREGAITSEWGPSENNRRARFYRLTRAGGKLLETEKRDWEETAAIIARFLAIKPRIWHEKPASILHTFSQVHDPAPRLREEMEWHLVGFRPQNAILAEVELGQVGQTADVGLFSL